MTNLNKFLLLTILCLANNLYADDIWFISPQPGQSIQDKVTIQIQPPHHNVPVTATMEYDMGREYIVWTGQLTSQNNYTITVDVSKFKPGKYQIDAKYYIQGEDYDGDIEFWIGTAPGPNGQYFPPQP